MAYNQPYFNGYYQPQQMQMPQQSVNAPAPTSDFIWVQGESGAKSFLVAPNSTVTLWDSENPTIYIKSANAQGVPTLRTLDFVERTTENTQKQPTSHECKCGDKYATKEQFEALKGKVNKSAKKIFEPITSEDYD